MLDWVSLRAHPLRQKGIVSRHTRGDICLVYRLTMPFIIKRSYINSVYILNYEEINYFRIFKTE